MGLATLAVVWSHAARWAYDQAEGILFYICISTRQAVLWAVPAFLLVSGYFAGYAMQRRDLKIGWSIGIKRVVALLVPYLLWSAIFYAVDALQGVSYQPAEYATRILTGKGDGPYYFVPLLCQFYLVAPYVIRMAETQSRWLLVGSALIQMGTIVARWYLDVLAPAVPVLYRIPGAYYVATVLIQRYLPFMWLCYFTTGIVIRVRPDAVEPWLRSHRKMLAFGAAAFLLLTIVLTESVRQLTGVDWLGLPYSASGSVYALLLMLWFISSDSVRSSLPRLLAKLNAHAYGVFLLHMRVMLYLLLAMSWQGVQVGPYGTPLLHVALFVAGLGIPVILMRGVRLLAIPKVYAYLFG